MRQWFRQLDEILRGKATHPALLQEGIPIPPVGMAVVIAILCVTYGLCMGSFAMIRTSGGAWPQLVSAAVKVPMLFFFTLLITFPSLYVFNALMGTRLTISSALRLLLAMLAVLTAVLASLGPIVVFFAVSTTSYNFMVVLNVIMGLVSGLLALAFLLRTLNRLVMASIEPLGQLRQGTPPPLPASPDAADQSKDAKPELPPASASPHTDLGALEETGSTHSRARNIFRIWVVMFALVGVQMSWILRPFVGDPNKPFEFFRMRESNFFQAFFHAIGSLFR